MDNEDRVELKITMPASAGLDGPQLRGYLEDELRTRAEVTAAEGTSAEGTSVTIIAYRREEVEAVADELVIKLGRLGVPEGSAVRWVDDNGADVTRSV